MPVYPQIRSMPKAAMAKQQYLPHREILLMDTHPSMFPTGKATAKNSINNMLTSLAGFNCMLYNF
jgi:hypothetical protein